MEVYLAPGIDSTNLMEKSSDDSTNLIVKSGRDSTKRHSPQPFGEEETILTSKSAKDSTTLTSKSARDCTTFTFPYSGMFLQEHRSLSMGLVEPAKSKATGTRNDNNSVFMA